MFTGNMWYHSESNQGHTDFQSVALPAELWYHNFFDDAKVKQFFYIKKKNVFFPKKNLSLWPHYKLCQKVPKRKE